MALEDARETVAHFSARASNGDRARDVGRAVFILTAAVDQENAAPDLQVGSLADAIMRDRGIGAGGGNAGKRNVLQLARLAPERLQRLRCDDFSEFALGRFAVQPGEKTGDGDPVA